MVDELNELNELKIPPEVAELVHREEMLRRAGQELLEEANTLRARYENIISQLRKLRGQERPEVEADPEAK